jgi:EmrB/QacA subfamily drug resistance transporter
VTAYRPWPALWALVIGFFMILVDTTIVSIANPAIMAGLRADISQAIWVTSAYLLTYAVPLLVTGRLGDRFGPRRVYLAGLTLFTLASLWCGLSTSIGMLIAARAVQGVGASLLTPQTMAVITRTFAPDQRGRAMSLWGATAAVATLVGPVLGGLLVDSLGWQWIFFVNVPVGVIGFVLAWRLVPVLETHRHRFDLPGVALWSVAMFCIVFGIQEGERYDWGPLFGPLTVPGLIVIGVVVLAVFVWWQTVTKGEPLLPLKLFADRNFSLANAAIATVGFAVTSNALPLVFYYQLVLGFTPTRAALQLVPMAVVSGGLAPVVGRLVDRVHPRYLASFGLALMAAVLVWYHFWLVPDEALWWRLLIPSAVMGVAAAFTYSPIGTTATFNLPVRQAGAGSGVYNSTRQVGSVLGSAAIAALIQAQLVTQLPGGAASGQAAEAAGRLPAGLQAGFAAAMANSVLLPAAAAALGAVLTAFFVQRRALAPWTAATVQQGQPAASQGALGLETSNVSADSEVPR